MDKFTASNGVKVERDGEIIFTTGGRIFPPDADALREFFQAERDEELGRWRSPVHPDFTVYVVGESGEVVTVMNEGNGQSGGPFMRADVRPGSLVSPDVRYFETARAYFEAHPKSARRIWPEGD